MKISIIVPIYNEEETIQNCLEALREQDYPKNDYEIIVFDDFSIDKTTEIVKKILDVSHKNILKNIRKMVLMKYEWFQINNKYLEIFSMQCSRNRK